MTHPEKSSVLLYQRLLSLAHEGHGLDALDQLLAKQSAEVYAAWLLIAKPAQKEIDTLFFDPYELSAQSALWQKLDTLLSTNTGPAPTPTQKNTIDNSQIKVEGDFHLGDNTTTTNIHNGTVHQQINISGDGKVVGNDPSES